MRTRLSHLNWDQSDLKRIRNIAKDLLNNGSDSYNILAYDQGTGKSTAQVAIAKKNDFLLFKTHDQAAEKRELLKDMGEDPEKIRHLMSLQKMIELPDYDNVSQLTPAHVLPDGPLQRVLPDDILEARANLALKELEDMNRILDKWGHSSAVKEKFDNEIIRKYENQYDEVFKDILDDNIYFGSMDNLGIALDSESGGEDSIIFIDETLRENPKKREYQPSDFSLKNFRAGEINALKYIDVSFEESIETYGHINRIIDSIRAEKMKEKEGDGIKAIGIKASEVLDEIEDSSKIDLDDFSDLIIWFSGITRANRFTHPETGEEMFEKPDLDKELISFIKSNNRELFNKLKDLERKMEIMEEWLWPVYFERSENNEEPTRSLYYIEKNDEARMGWIKPREAEFFEDDIPPVVISNAEYSREYWRQLAKFWSDEDEMKRLKEFGFKGEGPKDYDGEVLRVRPSEHSDTFTRSMMDKDRYQNLYDEINSLAERKSVGAIGKKSMASEFSDDVEFVNWARVKGSNKLRDVEALFVFSSPRPMRGEVDYNLRACKISSRIPGGVSLYRKFSETGSLKGFSHEGYDLIYQDLVERGVRDAMGRIRDQTESNRIFHIGIPAENMVNYDAQISMKELRGEMALMYGPREWVNDVSNVQNRHVSFVNLRNKYNISIKDVIEKMQRFRSWDRMEEIVQGAIEENVDLNDLI